MVDISKTAGSYAYVAPPGLNPNQKTLNEAAELAGRPRPSPTISFGIQARELGQFGDNLIDLVQPLGESERNRGFADSERLSLSLVEAYRNAAGRIRQAAAIANGQVAARPAIAGGNNNSIANVVASSVRNNSVINALFGRTKNSSSTAIASLLRIQSGVTTTPAADPYSRRLVTTYGSGGAANLEVRRLSLTASTLTVQADPGSTNTDSFEALRLVAGSNSSSANEGFTIKATGGARNDTFILDTRDPAEQDARLTSIEVDTGEGSDIVHISGANYSVIRAGAGNDFVTAEGQSIIYGGAGDDLLTGNTVSGDEGDDIIFSTSFASGGTGNDAITLFGIGDLSAQEPGTAYGGEGDDTILADIEAAVDGGNGNDRITLRSGGAAFGGAGDDVITIQVDGEADGGEGNDDILLLAGGTVLGGAGDDKLTASGFVDFTGGKGNDVSSLYGGGIIRFAAGDGQDRALIAEPEPVEGQIALPKSSQIVFSDLLYADVTATGSNGFVSVAVPGSTDKLEVTLIDQTQPLELRFGKGAQAQIVSFFKGVFTAGPVTLRDTSA